MVFTLEQDIFIGMAYFRTGNFDAANGWQYSTDEAFHQFQQMFPEPVVTLVAFRQHCMRLVQRYLHTGSGGSSGVAGWAVPTQNQMTYSF
jgi:hypothetical protein